MLGEREKKDKRVDVDMIYCLGIDVAVNGCAAVILQGNVRKCPFVRRGKTVLYCTLERKSAVCICKMEE